MPDTQEGLMIPEGDATQEQSAILVRYKQTALKGKVSDLNLAVVSGRSRPSGFRHSPDR